jgi:hypothetical protein
MIRVRRALPFLLAGVATSLQAFAAASYELRDLYRDTRMKAMGGAGVALQLEDKDAVQAIFTNPAQMAGNQDFTVHYLNGEIGSSVDTYKAIGDVKTAFSDFSFANLNKLMGKNIYANGQYVGAVTAPNLGVAVLLDGQAGFYAQNPSYPEYTLGYQATNGVQAAWGSTVDLSGPKSRRPRRGRTAKALSSSGSELRVGLGAKVFWRKGGYKDVPLSTLTTVGSTFLDDLMGKFELGYGIDAGVQFVRSVSQRFSWSVATSYQNLGDMDFIGSDADTQKGNLTAGLGLRFQLAGLTSLNVAYDHSHLNESTDWRKRQHFGLEWTLPGISIFGGIHQTYLSYGASFDAWIFRVTASSYAEELGGSAHEMGDRRYLLRLSMRAGL